MGESWETELRAADLLAHMHPVLPASKLGARPVQVQLGDRAYVLFRDDRGRPAALVDECPHRRAPLSAGRVRPDGRLACPYHGWHFDARGAGMSPSQPELRVGTRCLRVIEHLDHLWVGGEQAGMSGLPDEAQLGTEGFRFAGSFQMLFRAPLHVAFDNFSENEHTPWVHTRLGWDEAAADHLDFVTRRLPDRSEVEYRGRQRDSWLVPLLLLRNGDLFHNRWVTRFDPVRTEYTLGWTDPLSGRDRPVTQRAVIYFVPETARTTRFHVFLFLRLNDPRFRPLLPVVRLAALTLGWFEVRDDARFIPLVAGTPYDLRGLRLGRFDAPLVHNHKLLRRLYLGQDAAAEVETTSDPAQPTLS